MTIDEYLNWVKNNQNAPTPTGKPQDPVSSPVEKAGVDVPTAPQTIEVTPLVLMCHYRNPEMTEISVKTLLETNPWVRKVLIVDTSEEQNAPKDIDPRVQVISSKGSNHSQGVQKGLDWAKSKLYAGCKKGKDKWVLLLDSDVLFDHDVSGIIHESQKEGFVLTGHEQYLPTKDNITWIKPRIHPAFALLNITWLSERNIPFCDWEKIKPENMGPFGNKPEEWNAKESLSRLRARGVSQIYDVGSSLYEEVKQNGGKIKDLGTITELHGNGPFDIKAGDVKTVVHVGAMSWGDEKTTKMEFARKLFNEVCNNGK